MRIEKIKEGYKVADMIECPYCRALAHGLRHNGEPFKVICKDCLGEFRVIPEAEDK